MNVFVKTSRLFVVIFGAVAACEIASASAANVYIAQSAAGSANGSSCANADAYTFFNASANWGSGASQIGLGTTVHLCGTFTGSAGSTLLNFQGSGASGQPVTVLFEAGAALNAPYWGANSGSISQGAINVIGKSYIVINGQSSGSISATANGTNLTYQGNSAGVFVSGGSNVTVENLSISNMYIHVANSSTSGANASNISAGIQMVNSNSFTASGNTIHDAVNGIFMQYGSSSTGYTASGNTVYNCNWGIAGGDGGSNSSLSGLNVFGNTIHDAGNWDDANDTYHHNGIYFWAVQSSSNVRSINIYNNYIYGNMNQCSPNSCATGWISLLIGGSPVGTFTAPNLFNNTLVSGVAGSYAANGFIVNSGTGGYVVNNTIVGYNYSNGVGIGPGNGVYVYNNILSSSNYWMLETVAMTVSDYNDFYNGYNGIQYLGVGYVSLGAWQAASGFDGHSIATNPQLSSSYQPNLGSPVIAAGKNLYGVCNGQPNPGLGALCYDAAGTPRPTSGPWTIGAYGYTSGTVAPTGLSATAQ